MPAVSKKQRNFFNLVKSVQTGDTPKSKVSKNVVDVAKNMKQSDVEDFASTTDKELSNENRKLDYLGKHVDSKSTNILEFNVKLFKFENHTFSQKISKLSDLNENIKYQMKLPDSFYITNYTTGNSVLFTKVNSKSNVYESKNHKYKCILIK